MRASTGERSRIRLDPDDSNLMCIGRPARDLLQLQIDQDAMDLLVEGVCGAPFQSAAGKPASTIVSPGSTVAMRYDVRAAICFQKRDSG